MVMCCGESPEPLADELALSLIGASFPHIPYLVLAITGCWSPPWVRSGVLAALLGTAGLFFVAAASASTGAIIDI